MLTGKQRGERVGISRATQIEIVLIAGAIAIRLGCHLSPPIPPPGATNRRVAGAASGRSSAARVRDEANMPKGPRGEKRPADVIGKAVHVMRIARSEAEEQAGSNNIWLENALLHRLRQMGQSNDRVNLLPRFHLLYTARIC